MQGVRPDLPSACRTAIRSSPSPRPTEQAMNVSITPALRALLAATSLLLLVLALAAPAADARTVRVYAKKVGKNKVTFSMKRVAPGRIRAGRAVGPAGRRKLSTRRLRRAARRGRLRISSRRVLGRRARLSARARTTASPRVVLKVRDGGKGKPTKPAPLPEPEPTPVPVPVPSDPNPGEALPADNEAVPAGAFHVAPSGNDANPGTADAPWRTVGKAVASAGAGATVVLHAGQYGSTGTWTVFSKSGSASAPITFRGAPGEARPAILGAAKVTGSHVRLRGLLFDGPTGPVLDKTSTNPLGEEVQLAIYGSGVEVFGCEVRESLWHAGIYLDDAYDVRIVSNYVHDNGNFSRPEQANLDHGIYFGRGSGVIANNLIEGNLAHGVQLYPYASDVVVKHNTIVGQGKAGVIVAKEAANNLIINNIVANNADNSIRSSGLTGANNRVVRNVIWKNGSGNVGTSASGLSFTDNLQVDPMFTGPANFAPQAGSPAIDAANGTQTVLFDLVGRSRPLGGAPDVGAYEAG